MRLEKDLIEPLKQKGFTRQATLLESYYGGEYLKALIHPFWFAEVVGHIGNKRAIEFLNGVKDGFLESCHVWEPFEPRSYETDPLVTILDRNFDPSMIAEAGKMVSHIKDCLIPQAEGIVIDEAKPILKEDENLSFEIYKDTDPFSRDLTEAELRDIKTEWQQRISRRLEGLVKDIKRDSDWFIHKSCDLLNDMLFTFDLRVADDLIQEAQRILSDPASFHQNYAALLDGTSCELERCDYHNQLTQSAARMQKILQGGESSRFLEGFNQLRALMPLFEPKKISLKDLSEMLLTDARSVLSSNEQISSRFELYSEINKATLRERILEEAKFYLDYDWREDIHDDFFSLQDDLQILGEVELEGENLVAEFMKTPLHARKKYVEKHYSSLEMLKRKIVGLQQIIDGSPVNNPNISQLSILQNDARLPNLKYSEKTRQALKVIVDECRELLDSIPDLTDLAISSKMRKKKKLTYVMEELPKDPMDVTFGNDSGCCIYVPESKDKFQNGIYVPVYLTNPNIRLFAVYRAENGDKKQRMGLVLAFDTQTESGEDVLACNSLELSLYGISGGRDTISKITDYTEQWLVGYAQKHGYHGVTMGRHSYNTSANFSSKTGDIVEQTLVLKSKKGRLIPFYSDIFDYDVIKDIMKTRNNSCYWLSKGLNSGAN